MALPPDIPGSVWFWVRRPQQKPPSAAAYTNPGISTQPAAYAPAQAAVSPPLLLYNRALRRWPVSDLAKARWVRPVNPGDPGGPPGSATGKPFLPRVPNPENPDFNRRMARATEKLHSIVNSLIAQDQLRQTGQTDWQIDLSGSGAGLPDDIAYTDVKNRFTVHQAIGQGAVPDDVTLFGLGGQAVLVVRETLTGVQALVEGVAAQLTVSPSDGSANTIYAAVEGSLVSSGGQAIYALEGMANQALHKGSGACAFAIGNFLVGGVEGAGTVDWAGGVYSAAVAYQGTATRAGAGYFYLVVTSGGTMGTGYGVYVEVPATEVGATLTTVYGIYVADQKASTVPAGTAWGLYVDGATVNSEIVGLLGIGGAPAASTQLTVTAGADGTKGIQVRQHSGTQSANLTEWTDSTGATVKACVTATGSVFASGALSSTANNAPAGVYVGITSTPRIQLADGTHNFTIDNSGNTLRWLLDGTVRLVFDNAQALMAGAINVSFGLDGSTAPPHSARFYVYANIGAGTGASNPTVVFEQNTNGTPGAGFGGAAVLKGKSSTTSGQLMGEVQWVWVSATHASRTGRVTLGAHDSATSVSSPREGVRVEADGANARVSLFGATAVVQPASTGELVGLTGSADTSANATNMNSNGNLGSKAYSLNDIVKALKQLGILASS